MSNTLPLQTTARASLPSATRHGLGWTFAAAALLTGCQQIPQPPTYTTPALTAQPPRIEAGQSVRLSWDAPLGTSLRMSGLTATPPGAVLVRPAQTTTYTLSGPAPSGAPITASVTVEVLPDDEPLARLRIAEPATGASIAADFLGLAHDAGQAQQLMGDPATGPVNASYRKLLRKLQNYGSGPLSIRMDSSSGGGPATPAMLRPLVQLARDLPTRFILGVSPDAPARRLYADLPAGTFTLETARGANDCPAVEQLAHAAPPQGSRRCTAGPGAGLGFESALGTAHMLMDYAQWGVAGVNLRSDLWNTEGTLQAVEPQYYGMLFFAQFAGAQGQWLQTQLESGARIKAWAVRDARNQTVRVAVINQEPSTQGTVAVQLPAGLRQAVVTRLTTSDPLRLAGQTFDGSRDGRPLGTAYGEILEADSNGQLLLAMGANSAALLTLTPSAP
ncbi:glycosyl hydrolase family 79 C-terminal domain-containing protein [Pantoea sp. 18069]|uniref:glycosyl hydrolase family 79 C-terminal domain-containing protein n=1 Tax=Pantoea sp. 18069 TaxID=2681415 RepID=UPI00135A3B4A|nr:glycosyl hydrolase family 79 C-terminal domain-containing protein [Pantoea sp. 18069]